MIKLLLSILLTGIVISLFILMGIITNQHQKELAVFGTDNAYAKGQRLLRERRLFKVFYHALRRFLQEHSLEKHTDIVFYSLLGISGFLFIYFISVDQIFFAIFAPIVFLWITYKLLKMLFSDIDEKINDQLPFTIDMIIKVFSKYGDLKTVIYETAKGIDDPLKSRFENLARKMVSESQDKALMSFADELDNIWVHSMVFIILSYRENASKEDVCLNLRHLRSIVEKENTLKNSSVTDKHYGVILNYTIAIIAFLASIANLVFNPNGREFFFGSIFGLTCFVVGNTAIVATIMINIKLSSRKERRV